MNSSIRILLVDAPRLCRRSLATLLNRRRHLRVIGEAGTGTEALDRARTLQPDLVLLDPDVPDGGAKLVTNLCQESPDSAVLILTNHREQNSVSEFLQGGAHGYLHKDCEPEELVAAIDRVRAGELVVASGLVDAFVRDLGNERAGEPDQASLSPREQEVLRLVARGRTNPEIARQLSITEHTVKAHLAKIFSKLALENRVQLAAYATQQGILDPSAADASGSVRRIAERMRREGRS